MSILSVNFTTPITFDNVLEMCVDKPYRFYKKNTDPHNSHKECGKFIGSTSRIYYSKSNDNYYDMCFYLYVDKLVVIKYIAGWRRHADSQEYPVDCVETVIMLMDDYFSKYEFLKGDIWNQ